MQSICAPCHRHKGSKTSFGRIVQLAKARRVDTVARLVSQLCPYKSVLGANNGLKNVGLENIAINSTHFQWPDLDDFCSTVFATTPSRFEVSGTRLNTDDSFKWKQRLENKRHTNTHLAMRSAVTVSGSKRSPSGSVSAEQSSRKIRKNRSGEFLHGPENPHRESGGIVGRSTTQIEAHL